jgi:hypothetical protein
MLPAWVVECRSYFPECEHGHSPRRLLIYFMAKALLHPLTTVLYNVGPSLHDSLPVGRGGGVGMWRRDGIKNVSVLIFRVVTQSELVVRFQRLEEHIVSIFRVSSGSRMFLRNIGTYLPVYQTASQHRRSNSNLGFHTWSWGCLRAGCWENIWT